MGTRESSGADDGESPEEVFGLEDDGDRGQDDATERRDEPGEGEEPDEQDDDASALLDDLFAGDEDDEPEDDAESEGDDEPESEESEEEEGEEKAGAKSSPAMLKRIKTLSAKKREAEGRVDELTNELTTAKKALGGFTSLYPGEKGLTNATFDKRFMDTLEELRKPTANAGVRQVVQAVLDKMKGEEPEGDALAGRSTKGSEQGKAGDAATERLERIERREAESAITSTLRRSGVVKELHKSLTRDAVSRLSFKDGPPSESAIAKAVREAITDSGYSREFLTGKGQRRSGPPTGGGRRAGVVTSGRDLGDDRREEKPPKSQNERLQRGRRRLAAALGGRG